MKKWHISLILFLAAALRIGYWVEVHDEAWFIAPGTDPNYYLGWAINILDGSASGYLPFPRAPLYPYIVAGIQKVFGSWWLWLRLFNLACDLITVTLVYRIATRMLNHRTGLIAGSIFAVSGASIYFTGEVLMTSLATLMMTWVLSGLLSIKDKNAMLSFISSGFGIGLMALLRPNILLLLPFTTAYAFYYPLSAQTKNYKIRLSLIHLAAAILILMPVIVANFQASGRFIPVSSQGGVNFLIGNARGADGWSSTLPSAGPSWNTKDAAKLASVYAGSEVAETDVSATLWRMGRDEIFADPLGWISVMIKKSLLFMNFREIGNNRPLSLPRESSVLFNLLSMVSLGTVLPFALIGLIRFRKSHQLRFIGLMTLLYSFTIILFFVTTRYRTPIFPAIAVLAALGITELLNSRKSEKRFFQSLFIILIGGLITFPGWAGKNFDDEVQAHFITGNAHLRLNQAEKALESFQAALVIEPDFFELNLNLGVAYLSLGDTVKAADAFRKEIRNWQESPKAYNNLGVISEGQGEINEAISYYKRSLVVDGFFEDARSNLARIWLSRGDAFAQEDKFDSAAALYNQVIALKGPTAGLFHRLAIIELNFNNYGQAANYLQKGLSLVPDFEPSLNLLREIQFRE